MDKAGMGLTCALVLIGAFGICAAYRTLRAVESQGGIMQGQLNSMQGQLRAVHEQITEMSEQTAVFERSVGAAEKGAEATRSSVEMVIRKERARLSIELEKLEVPKPEPKSNLYGIALTMFSVRYVVKCRGVTEAIITSSLCSAVIHDSIEAPPANSGFGWPVISQNIILPLEPPVTRSHPILKVNGNTTWEDIESIKKGSLFVHCWGDIKYDDIFDGHHQTTFRKVWKFSELPSFGGEPRGSWWDYGQKEDNQET